MTNTPEYDTDTNQIVCPYCAGTGQVAGFRGVSRFVLSWEECPACSGSGISDPQTSGTNQDHDHCRKPSSAE